MLEFVTYIDAEVILKDLCLQIKRYKVLISWSQIFSEVTKLVSKISINLGKRVHGQRLYSIILNFDFLSISLLNNDLLQFINYISSWLISREIHFGRYIFWNDLTIYFCTKTWCKCHIDKVKQGRNVMMLKITIIKIIILQEYPNF